MYAAHAVFHRIGAGGDLGDHAAGDGAVCNELFRVFHGERREERGRILRVGAHAVDICQEDQLFRLERGGDGGGGGVRIDVVALAVFIRTDGGDDRNILVLAQGFKQPGVDAHDVAHMAQVHAVRERRLLFDLDELCVLAAKADGLAAEHVDLCGDVLVELAGQNHLHDLHRRVVRDAQAVVKSALHAHAPQHRVDLRPAAVYEDGVDAYVLEQGHVLEDLVGELFILHGVAAVFDDDGFAPKTLDVRQRFNEDIGFIDEKLIAVVDDLILGHAGIPSFMDGLK